MEEEGVDRNEFHFSSAISACARGSQAQECLKLLHKMEEMSLVPSVSTYNLILRELLNTKDWTQVLLLFYQIKHRLEPGSKEYRIAFTYALRACEHSKGTQTATDLYRELKDQDPEALKGLPAVVYFRTLAKAQQYSLAYDQLDIALEALEYVNLALVNYAIIVCAKNEDGEKALEILEQVIPKADITPDIFTYSAAVDACAKAGNAVAAKNVFNIAREQGHKPSVMMVNSMLHCYHQRGEWEDAMCVFNEMKQSPVKPDLITYSTMMHTISMYGNASLLPEMMDDLKEQQMIPVTRACNTVLCNLAKRHEGKVALQVLDKMEEMGIELTDVSYSATIAANDEKAPRTVMQVYERMWNAKIVPDDITYSMVLKALKRGAGSPESICALLREMWAAGKKINTMTYTRIFAILAKKGRPRLIRTLIDEMKIRGQEPTEGIYTALIVSLYKANKLSESLEELKRLRRQGKPVRAAAYTAVITACRRAREVNLAMDLHLELKRDPTRAPTLITYNALISVMTYSGEMVMAEKLVKELVKAGFEPDSITFQSLIFGYSRESKWELALAAMSRMQELSIVPKWPSYNEAIRATENLGDWKQALFFLNDMKENGLSPDVVMYGSILSNCAKASQWEVALDLLSKMEAEDGLKPSLICYSTVISACEKGGEWRKALNLLLRMINNGIEPDTIAYNSAISACTTGNEWQMALKLLDSMQQSGVKLDEITYSSAIAACYKGGQWQKALNLLILMRDAQFTPSYVAISTVIECLDAAKQYDKSIYVYNEFILSKDQERFDPSGGLLVDLHGFSQSVAKAAIRSGLRSLLQKYIKSGNDDQCVKDFTFITGIGRRSEKKFEPVLRPVMQDFLLKEFDPPLQTHFKADNEGRLVVYKNDLLSWLRKMTTPKKGISPAEQYGTLQLRWPSDLENDFTNFRKECAEDECELPPDY
eukprot:CAMPEP_0117756924 /NCGR_PEP_ID=MMETSP0947-20121206/14398_1 /TAXON_ID=44440 /ORGANISM="Chattonella subsalsa, Strain CCMP2191" /LENGTH=939 /DNA_ID=CAMNT_0005576665 /DNA_START=451 /DNA_END=3270 /DNA_ORIENTATION=+